MLEIIIATLAGVSATTQAGVNAETRNITKSPYFTSAFNFAFSMLVLAVVILILQHNLHIAVIQIAKQYPAWVWIGGCCGPFVIMTSVHSVPALGSAKHMMLASTAQILTGLLIDQLGLFGLVKIGLSPLRAVGAALVLAGIIVVSTEKSEGDRGEKSRTSWIYVFLSLINGTAAAVQVAANGNLNSIIRNTLKTTLVSMCLGLTTMCVLMILVSLFKGPDALFEGNERFRFVKPIRKMLYGGALAVIVVGGNSISVKTLGTGLVNILNLTGMMGMALFTDAIGFLGLEKKPVTMRKVAGMALILSGAAVISLI